MKLAIIFPVLNQHTLAHAAIVTAMANVSSTENVELIVIDNASDEPFTGHNKIVRLEKNIGVYPIFWEALKHTDADVLAFFHSDLFVAEKGFDTRIIEAFKQMINLGLLGFIGSNQIDSSGGRGLGTTSNFQGSEYEMNGKIWHGSPALVHGKAYSGYSKAAVVDGCAMIFRRTTLEDIKQRENFPPHHFYDRLLSCEVRELGYEVGVLGIACDHISGQTVNQESAYHRMANEWIKEHMDGMLTDSPDMIVYVEAERQWLEEYRDIKKLVPVII
jgi:hypothetical protein